MKGSLVLALLAACTQSAHAVVQFPFVKHGSLPQNVAKGGSKARALNTGFFQGAMTYVVNATVGTPGQPVSLVLAPSSSDTWVVDTRSDQCTYYSTYYSTSYDGDTDPDESSCLWGSFSPNVSTTFVSMSESLEDDDSSSSYSSSYDFSHGYDDGSYAYGDYFNDSIALGDVSLDVFTLGLVNDTDRYIGMLGLGYNDSVHSTFTDRLVSEGLINSTTYSIWVDDSEASSGNILFGAIDTTKFEGSLFRVASYYSGYQMLMTISSINATTQDSDGPITITYDAENDDSYYGSSSTSPSSSSSSSSNDYLFSATFAPTDSLSVLPDDVASQFWEVAGAYYDSDTEMALIGCNAGNTASTNFTFRLGNGPNGPNITAVLEDLIVPVTDVDVTTYASSYFSSLDTDEVCLFGVQNRSIVSSSSYSYTSDYSLGSGILRRTYSVFDFVNDEIAIAPVKFGATETSNVVAFATYGSTAPSSTMLCVLSSCSKTTTSGGGTSSGGSSNGDDGGLANDILSVPALVGVSVGVGLGALSVGIIGYLIWRHRMRRRMAGKDAGSVTSAEAGEAAPPLPSRGAAGGAAPGPEMTQASQPHAGDKGKAPEIPMPENLASTSTHGHGQGVQGSEPAQASSSRDT